MSSTDKIIANFEEFSGNWNFIQFNLSIPGKRFTKSSEEDEIAVEKFMNFWKYYKISQNSIKRSEKAVKENEVFHQK